MNDPNNTNSSSAAPQVSSKTPPIPGVIPQNIRTWLTLLVAGLMLVSYILARRQRVTARVEVVAPAG